MRAATGDPLFGGPSISLHHKICRLKIKREVLCGARIRDKYRRQGHIRANGRPEIVVFTRPLMAFDDVICKHL